MNTLVFPESTGSVSTWGVEEAPPARSRVATIERRQSGFYIVPAVGPGGAVLSDINSGPYDSMDDVLDAISAKTQGTCERY